MMDQEYFQEIVRELINDLGYTPEKATALARELVAPPRTASVRLWSNKIRVHATVMDAPAPVKTVPEHPYGTAKSHNLNFTHTDENGDFVKSSILTPDTPDWEEADGLVKSHFGGKLGLHDLAKAYSMPGMRRKQTLNIEHRPGQGNYDTSLGVKYSGEDPSRNNFSFELTHGLDDHLDHKIDWDDMTNEDKSSPHLMNLMSQTLPLAQKSGIKSIDTYAVSNAQRGMNGGHTWANLGFGFKQPYELENAKRNLGGMLKHLTSKTTQSTEGLNQEVQSATHPFQLKDVARRFALAHRKAYQNENNMMQYEEPLTAHHAWNKATTGDRWAGAAFEGRLNLDPNDIGYQRMMQFMKHHRANQ